MKLKFNKYSINLFHRLFKITFLLTAISIFGFYQSSAQLSQYIIAMDGSQTLYNIKSGMEIYLDSMELIQDSTTFYAEGGEYSEYQKFMNYWEPRLFPHGDFNKAIEADFSYYRTQQGTYPYFSNDNWFEIGPNNTSTGIGPTEFLSIFDIGTPQSTKYMLTASLLGGVFYSNDYGASWNSTNTDTQWELSGSSCAIFHPSDHTIWFASSSGNSNTGSSSWIRKTGGVYITLDEGENWEQIADYTNFGPWSIVYKLLAISNNPDILFAVTSTGIWRSDDFLESDPSWDNVSAGLSYDIELKPGSNSTLYATSFIIDAWKILLSNDTGVTWDELDYQPRVVDDATIRENSFTIEVSKAKPDYLYCVANKSGDANLYYYDFLNPGNWNQVNLTPFDHSFSCGHGFGVEQVNNGEDVIVSSSVTMRRFDINNVHNGHLAPPHHIDVEDIIFHPYVSNTVWACTHGGVEKSLNGGSFWWPKYEGLGVANVDKMANSFTNPEYVLVGLYHDGTLLSSSPYSPDWDPDWEMAMWGDGMRPLIDNINPNNMWASYQNGAWRFSYNYFSTSARKDLTTGWNTDGVLNKVTPQKIYRHGFSNTTDELFEVFCTDGNGEPEKISSFQSLYPGCLIWQLFTPYTNGNHLLVSLRDTLTDTWHLFRTTNVNDQPEYIQWEELTIPRNDGWIASVDFDPYNENIVYIVYSNSASEINIPYADQMIFKIDYTNPTTPVTIPITKNLPYTSTSGDCIEIDNTTQKGIYLYTTYGIFYTNIELLNSGFESWELYGNILPHTRAGKLEINYVCNKLRAGLYGRGLWEIPLPCYTDEGDITVSNDENWNENRSIKGTVTIAAPSVLTIENAKISFGEDSKIIIQPGAKLVVDGGTLCNSACSPNWQGIEVWGTTTAGQDPEDQGWIIINNGTIENAITGVVAHKSETPGFTGGIIQGINSVFKNNITAIQFGPYEPSSLSSFINCQFISDDDYPFQVTPFAFVSITDQQGIVFTSCSFNNTSVGIINMPERGAGIRSTNGGFSVIGQSSFDGLYYGIYGTEVLAQNTFNVHDATFDSYRGIYMSASQNNHFSGNTFTVPKSLAGINNNAYGLYMEYSTGYKVEDNTFTSAESTPTGIGMYINSSGTDDNEVYRNNFNNLQFGIIAQDINRNRTIGGLVIKCNTFANIVSDISVTFSDDPGLYTPNHGISKNQGANSSDPEMMAGNLFYYNGTPTDFDDLDNSLNHFNYYYALNTDGFDNVEPLDFTFNTVTKEGKTVSTPWTYTNGCPPSSSGGGGRGALRSMMTTASYQADSTSGVLNLLVDGGDTPELTNEVDLSTPPQTTTIYNDLMNNSPYLSDSVVESAIIKEDVLPNAMLRDIMVANAHSAKSDELMNTLDSRSDPMPDYMKAQILQGRALVSLKEETESRLGAYNLNKARAFNGLKRYFMDDTLNPAASADSLVALMQSATTLNSQYQLALLRLKRNEYTLGSTVMSNIPLTFTLSAGELTAHQNMVDYYNWLMAVKQSQGNIMAPDSTQQLWTLMGADSTRAGIYARNLLVSLGEITYTEPIVLPDLYKSTQALVDYETLLNTEAPNLLKVFPNPTSDFIIIEYILETDVVATIQIQDVRGITHQILKAGNQQDQITVITSDWVPGIYIVSLKVNGKLIESTKFAVIK